ncbi:MAG: UxaA family hydrolase [Hyphomicrobiaceae bacterium]
MSQAETFLGYERADGRVGIRNWVAVVSVMENCNSITRAVVRSVLNTVPVATAYVRGQIGQDLEITMSVLAGLATNPNIGGVVIVGLEPVTSEDLARRIRPSGLPVAIVNIQETGGTLEATMLASRQAARMVRAASAMRRKPFPVSRLTVGVECGGSDTTSGLASNPAIGVAADRIVSLGGQVVISETSEFLGAEHVFADRAATPAVRDRFLAEVHGHERRIMDQGVDLRGSNPTRDNIRGGLTTIEEKSLGAMAKAGTTPLVGIIGYGERPSKPGLHFMATPAPAVESLTGLAAGGCQINLFSTGVGNPIGSVISTTIKVTGNRNTAQNFSDNIDCDVSGILEAGERVAAAGARVFDYMLSVASGELTSAEILDARETSISRFGLSM